MSPTFRKQKTRLVGEIQQYRCRLCQDRALSVVPGTDDLVFQGDMTKWVKFANTLKLKLLIRQSESRPNVTTAGVQALYAAGAEFLDADAQGLRTVHLSVIVVRLPDAEAISLIDLNRGVVHDADRRVAIIEGRSINDGFE